MTEKTDTPQEYFPYVGNLENIDAIADISKQMLIHTECGLRAIAIDDRERALLRQFEAKLSNYQNTNRAEWAELKEQCLTLLGSPLASVVDYLVSALRTPAVAESAIRSAGWQLIEANQAKARLTSQAFMRGILSDAIKSNNHQESHS